MYTEHRTFKLEKGLVLEERKRERFLKARAHFNGRSFFLNTETTDFARAERVARSWFKRLQSDATGQGATSRPHTMHEAAKSFLADIQKPITKEFYLKQWNAISDLFTGIDVDAVTTPFLKDFLRRRRERSERQKRPLTTHTQKKDMVCLRRILHHCVEEGWLDTLPVFPKMGKVEANPRPWLDPDEWKTLQRVAKERIRDAPNVRTKAQREELYDFCLMMVHSCARVDEVRNLRMRDCVVKEAKRRPYLELRIVQGKRGTRKNIAWSGAVSAFRRLVARRGLAPDDFLFAEHHIDSFRELLEAAGLRWNSQGKPRNFKALRSTGLMMRIKANPRINLKLLAENSGTSVNMLDQFYLKRLTVDMHVEELV